MLVLLKLLPIQVLRNWLEKNVGITWLPPSEHTTNVSKKSKQARDVRIYPTNKNAKTYKRGKRLQQQHCIQLAQCVQWEGCNEASGQRVKQPPNCKKYLEQRRWG